MTFQESIGSCFRQYATFSGRASRSEFWWFYLFNFLVSAAAALVGYSISDTAADTLHGLLTLALILPNLAVGARRLHDIDRTGWWQLLLLTIIGFFVLLYFWVQPTEPNENRFGPPPA
ncbi:DUF805 domain-containing protein [Xanthobacter pseudotagetidis]|uniref:DUF805 domain-containing protein n=1 Tax=Xanthobacter pseudotagetidis TaxID=3119911 RepID=UPI003726FFDC